MQVLDSVVHLNLFEYQRIQSFLGHGPLLNAQYIFMGREEGLGDADGDNEESVRKRLMWYDKFKNVLGYLPKREEKSTCIGYFIEKTERTERKIVNSPTMYFQAYAKLVLDSDFAKLNKDIRKEDIKRCMIGALHASGGNTAMTELYPLPKQGKLCYRVEGENWNNYQQARASWEDNTNLRRKLLIDLYNNYPLPMTICYAGVENKKFIAEKFFVKDLKFNFKRYNTGMIPEKLKGRLNPSLKPKDIFIGERMNPSRQRVILTPFWGVGCISYDDINAILAWAVS